MIPSNQSTYWLLDVVVEHRVSLDSLVSDGDPNYFNRRFRRSPHGLTPDALYELLVLLFEQGLLLTWPITTAPLGRGEPGFSPSRAQIAEALQPQPITRFASASSQRLLYGLSAAGGVFWESLSRPDWDRYVLREETHRPIWDEAFDDSPRSYTTRRSGRQYVRTTSANQQNLEKLLEVDTRILQVLDPDSIQQYTLTQWDATYWKTLNVGYRMEYSLWPEAELVAHGVAVPEHSMLLSHPERRGDFWHTDFLTGEPAR